MADISFDQAFPVLYQGWDKASAQANFAATGGKDKAGYSQLVGGGSSSPSSSFSGFNPIDIAKQIQGFTVEANKPAISSLEASRPEISQRFGQQRSQLAAEKQPLQDRYKSLIDTIKGNQTQAENRQTLTSRNELGRRGIPLNSGLAEQSVTDAVNPLTQQFTGMIKDTGLQQESDLRGIDNLIANLTGQEVSSLRDVTSAIAQLQAGNPSQAITSAISQAQANQQAEMARQQAERDSVQRAFENQLKTKTFDLTSRSTDADIANTYSQIAQRGSSSTANEQKTLEQIFGGFQSKAPSKYQSTPPSYFKPIK